MTEFVAHGRIDVRDVIEALTHFYADEQQTINSLWDFTDADLSGLSAHDIQMIADFVAVHAQERVGSKAALVFSSDLEYGLGRMIDAQLEIELAPVFLQSFKNKEAAQLWLNRPEP
ncbi:hypothetical protein [Desulfofustis limnaeus]|nr:hypothetical protein [Desulfofustis limnaeus]MDX9893991.1 hypothetical protein [Desulfofustis sp.]